MEGAVAGLILVAVLVLFAIVVVAKSVKVIPQAEAAVIERLGRYSKTVSGQLTLLLQFIDKIRARVDLRERVVSFPPQPVITEDNLTVNIDTVVYFQVTNPQAAVYQICFFQAEDGIRDIGVTGVQTCALPIFGVKTGPTAWQGPLMPGLEAAVLWLSDGKTGAVVCVLAVLHSCVLTATAFLVMVIAQIGRASCRERV